jgi:uncharacterized SAM-binding protein YcdF (DUF218 family)
MFMVANVGSIYQLFKTRQKIFVILFISFVFFSFLLVRSLIGYVKDLPNLQKQEFLIATGTVTKDSLDREFNTRKVEFELDEGKVLLLSIRSDPIHKGDRFEFIYFPNSKNAVIVKELSRSCQNKPASPIQMLDR